MSASVPPPPLPGAQPSDVLGYRASTLLSFVLSGMALWLLELGVTSVVLLVSGFALLFAQQRRAREAVDAQLGLAAELELADLLLGRAAHGDALVVACRVAERASSPRLQRAAVEAIAWAQLGLGRPTAARDALSWVRPQEALDPLCCAAVEAACGESRWALHLLDNAARRRPLSREATLFRIDLCAQLRGVEDACRLTLRELGTVTHEDARRVLAFAGGDESAGASALARELSERDAAA
jgi:hypothetical protein